MKTLRSMTVKLLVAATAFGGVYAMAASLGGLSTGAMGADDALVASCDTDGVSTASAPVWDSAVRDYAVGSVTVSGIAPACNGATLSVALVDTSGDRLAGGTATVGASSSSTVSLATSPAVSRIAGVHVAIVD